MNKCIDKKGHDYEFLGYMVVAEELPKNSKSTPVQNPPMHITATTLVGFQVMPVPHYFPAKIEVHQCKKCGDIKLAPAVFSRL